MRQPGKRLLTQAFRTDPSASWPEPQQGAADHQARPADAQVVVLAPRDPVYQKVVSNVEEVKARHGRIIAVVSDDAPELQGKVDHMIKVPHTLPFLLPVLTTIPLQLLAYHFAVMRGADVDQPRNLAKSVTVE
jgi:glucosamine--fructose-6-phosphate aminotransferase (isomerizing)